MKASLTFLQHTKIREAAGYHQLGPPVRCCMMKWDQSDLEKARTDLVGAVGCSVGGQWLIYIYVTPLPVFPV